MSLEWQPLGRALVFFGVIVTAFGIALLFAPRLPWLGHLPGDIAIRRDGFSFYFPLTSCLLASVILSVLFWLAGRFKP